MPIRRAVLVLSAALVTLPPFGRASAQALDPGGPSFASLEIGSTSARSLHEKTAPRIAAARLRASVEVDGSLDEAAWAIARVATRFTQTDPIDGAAPSERTEVRIAFDADAIYVGARLYEKGGVSTRLGGRDSGLPDSDWLTIVFDSYHDHQGGYRFSVNPSGVKRDAANGDGSWNPVWDVGVTTDRLGWTVEMRIPLSQLHFNPGNDTWGVQMSRSIAKHAENDVFAYTPRGEVGGAARYAHLTGLAAVRQGRQLELLPYAVATAEVHDVARSASVAFDNPFSNYRDLSQQVGADIKYRLTPNFTIDGTVNPDFAQVEADAASVNLSANETFHGERRPFFIEGSNIFDYGRNDLFYSRRIGRAPHGSVPSQAAYADVPSATRILGAAKLTGRTASGWSVGVLEAVTPATFAPWVDTMATQHSATVEPLTNYFVGRVTRDFRDGESTVGGIMTSVVRNLADSALAQQLRGHAVAAGLDASTSFDDRRWELSGAITGTNIHGRPATILAAQRSSIRYFQRPDARRLHVDSAAESLAGYRATLALAKHGGKHWRGRLSGSATSPGYETNDVGFLTGTDRLSYGSMLQYREDVPGDHLRRWSTRVTTDASWNYDGDIVGNWIALEQNVTRLDYWSGRIGVRHHFPTLDDRLTRGGPLTRDPGGNSVDASVSSDGRDPYTMSAWASAFAAGEGSWSRSQGVNLGLKTASSWTANVQPSFSRSHGAAQYVASIPDTLALATYGSRYVFADIDQTTLSVAMRMNVTVSPTLTLGLAAQPFLASAHYETLKELDAPRTYDFDAYGLDQGTVARDSADVLTVDPDAGGPAAAFSVADPSFSTRALNGTASLRWEWRPGSTMFFVWQQRRGGSTSTDGDFDLLHDGGELLRARPVNVVSLKVNYWLNL